MPPDNVTTFALEQLEIGATFRCRYALPEGDVARLAEAAGHSGLRGWLIVGTDVCDARIEGPACDVLVAR